MNETFAVRDSSGTWYLDLTANAPLGEWIGVDGLTLVAHWGWQNYSGRDPRNVAFIGNPSNDDLYSYKDYKIGLTYALPKDFTIGAMYTGTTGLNDAAYGTISQCTPQGCGSYPSNLGKGTATVFIQKTF
jgi:hypothetical protein